MKTSDTQHAGESKGATLLPRRDFLRLTALSGAYLSVCCAYGRDVPEVTAVDLADGDYPLNQFIVMNGQGRILLYNHRPEMGQGTYQSVPMILAEELEVDVNTIEILPSEANEKKYGSQNVVGSRSIQTEFENLRKMGAAAREMLKEAAARRWGIDVSKCTAANGQVTDTTSGRKLQYAGLVAEASKLTPPSNPPLKAPAEFKIIGTSVARRDIPLKTNGAAEFGMDITVPGMMYASVERSPLFIGKVVSYNEEKAKAVPGVKHVVRTQRNVWGRNREGVAVVAESYWAATQGRKALDVKWDNSGLENLSSESLLTKYKEDGKQAGVSLAAQGDVDGAINGKTVVEAAYETPYQSHVCMEPMNAIVSVQDNKVEFWGSTQNPNGVRGQLSKQFGVAPENVSINYTFMGGGFGRRSMTDVAEEAGDISKKVSAPVKVIWTREDDLAQGPFRAASLNICKGVVENGKAVALEHKVVCQEIQNQTGDKLEAGRQIAGGINTLYEIPNWRVSGVLEKNVIPITYWRSVYHSTNCFAHESFIDEMAVAAKQDPIDFRLAMLKNHSRYTKILQVVAEKSNWYSARPVDTGRGVSILERSGAFTAMVVEVKKMNGRIIPVKVVAVVDVGICVNPDTVRAQTEGSVVMGLTAAYKSAITIKGGKVEQQNFSNYQMLRYNECPPVETYIIESTEKPEGAGESGLANVAPSLCNAIFNLTGKRIRKLPVDLTTLS